MKNAFPTLLALLVLPGMAAAQGAGQGPCPTGWHLKEAEKSYRGGSVFRCLPDMPATKVACHPDTEYFEEDGSFGCGVPAEIEDDLTDEE